MRTRKSCSRVWPRSGPGSRNTLTCRSGASSIILRRPDSSRTRWCSTPPTTAPPAKAAEWFCQREQVLQRLSRRSGREHENDRQARRTGYLWPFPDRMGGSILDTVPDVQALLAIFRRHVPIRSSSPGRRASRRVAKSATSTITRSTLCPTILDVVGVEMPKVYRGVEQFPLSGVSMRYTFDAAAHAPTQKKRQYYSMLGTRGMWEEGWMAAAVHAPFTGKGHFDEDRWQLYHVDADRSESTDLAEQYPEKLQALIKAWFEEADDQSGSASRRPQRDGTVGRRTALGGTASRPLRLLPGYGARAGRRRRQRARSLVQDPRQCRDHRCGCSRRDLRPRLALRRTRAVHQGSKLYYVYNFLGIKPEQKFVSSAISNPANTRSAWSSRGAAPVQHHESLGTTKLYVNDKVVAEGPMKRSRPSSPCRATVSASATTAAMPSAPNTRRPACSMAE